MSLAEFISTTLGDDFGNMPITAKLKILKKIYICIIGMSEQPLHFITDPLKSFIFTLSTDSVGHLLTNRLLVLSIFWYFTQIKDKYLFMNKKKIWNLSKKTLFFPHI